ncbi:MAG: type VI secretion system tube protein Hcp [Thermodesulfobacteriota bacterium]|jgi:type VI secretion system secreted protein Hcp
MLKDKRTAMVGVLVAALFLSLLTLTNPGKALAGSAFLKVDGVPGESTDDKHKDYIEVISWSFGDTNSGSPQTGAGGGAGKVNMQNFRFTMRTNKASPILFGTVANGKHIPKVVLEVCKSGGGKETFSKITLSDVLVSSFVSLGSSGTGSADVYPMEEIMLNFSKIEVSYTQLDPQTGKPKGDIKFNWDVKANTGS